MAVKTWNGGGTTNNTSDGGNWGGAAPVDGDSWVFSGSTRQTINNDLTANMNVAGITFNTANFDISTGNDITLTGNISNAGGNNCHIRINMATTAVRTIACSFQLHIEGTISGAGGGFTKTGASTLFLYANNTCTGAYANSAGNVHLYGSNTPSGVSINGGTSSAIYAYATNSMGTGGFSFATGATTPLLNIRIDGGGTITMGCTIGGNTGINGTLDVNNNGSGTNGVVTFSVFNGGNSTYTFTGGNGYTVRLNTCNLTGGGAATMGITANVNVSMGTTTQTFAAAHTLALAGTATGSVIDGVISNGVANALSITKAGTGTWSLSGTNTYTGTRGVSAGRLVFSGNQAGSTTGATSVTGGVLEVATPASIPGTARNVTITLPGLLVFTAGGFTQAQIATALLGRVVASSNGVICGDHYGSTNFDFQTAGLTAAYFGCEDNLTYSGTFTVNTTAGYKFYASSTKTLSFSNILAGTTTSLLVNCPGTVEFNGSGNNQFGTVQVCITLSGGTLRVTANGSFTCGTGAHTLLIADGGFTGTLDLSAASATTINVTTVTISNGSFSASTGTLNLGSNTSITASTGFYVIGNVAGNSGAGCFGTVTTAASSTVTISTPEIIVGRNKTNIGTFTSGTSSTVTIQGTSGGRCALSVGQQEEGTGGPGRFATGTMDFSAGIVTLTLSKLQIGIDNATTTIGNGGSGTVIIGTSSSNHIDIRGTSNPVIVGWNAAAGTSASSGTLTLGNCDATSAIIATDNSDAILLGTAGAGGGSTATGTLNLGGTLTITTTGDAITKGNGTGNVTVTNDCTLKPGVASTTWIAGLSYFKINSAKTLTLDTTSGDVTIPQIIADGTGAGRVTKAGTGTWTSAVSNTFTGQMTINGGTFAYGANNVLVGDLDINGGDLSLGAFTDTVGVVTIEVGNITGAGTLTSTTSFTFYNSGSVNCSAVLAGVGIPLTMTGGGGTTTLSGACTYTGATTVSLGTLALSSTGSIAAGSAISVNGGTLTGPTTTGGSATAAGTLAVMDSASAILEPGAFGNNTLNTGALTFFGTNSRFKVDSTTTTFSKANVTGAVALGGMGIIVPAGITTNGTYDIIVASGSMTGTLPSIVSNLTGKTVTVQQTANKLQLVVSSGGGPSKKGNFFSFFPSA